MVGGCGVLRGLCLPHTARHLGVLTLPRGSQGDTAAPGTTLLLLLLLLLCWGLTAVTTCRGLAVNTAARVCGALLRCGVWGVLACV